MTPKHMFSLDHNVFDILPCSMTDNLMTEDLFAASCENVFTGNECAMSVPCTQDQCFSQSAVPNVASHGYSCKQPNGIDLNIGDRSCPCVQKDAKHNSNDNILQSHETSGASAMLQKIELLQIADASLLTADVHSAGDNEIESVTKPHLLVPHADLECCECNELPSNGSPSIARESEPLSCNSVLNIFDGLPLEIQHKILSYLSPTELCHSVATVCKRWHGLAYEPILWQHLTFSHSVPLDAVKKIIQRSSLVRYLSLFGFPDVSVFLPQLVNCHFLLCLDLKMCGGLLAESISLLVRQCPLVESLNVEGCRNIDNAAIAEIVGWKRMRSLNLSHCTFVQDESVVLLAQEFHLLQELNIDGIENISDAAVTVLVDRRKSTLQKLLLDGEDLTDVTYRSLCNCTGLNELCVSFAVLMSDQGLVAIKELTGLKNLKIKRGSELSESGLQALFENQNLCHLTSLDLSGCSNLEDTGVDAMTKCCSRLQFLGLEWCWDISDKGLEMIVGRCRLLKVMNLVGLVKITGACFTKIPECMPQLTYLDLQQCSRIIDDIVEDVVRRKPDLTVLDYYGEEVHTDIMNGAIGSDSDERCVCICGQHMELQ